MIYLSYTYINNCVMRYHHIFVFCINCTICVFAVCSYKTDIKFDGKHYEIHTKRINSCISYEIRAIRTDKIFILYYIHVVFHNACAVRSYTISEKVILVLRVVSLYKYYLPAFPPRILENGRISPALIVSQSAFAK